MLIPSNHSPKMAEALLLRSAIEWVLSLGKENAIFETDGKVVVDAMHLSTVDLSEFGTIVQDCIYLLEQGVNFAIQFVQKQANRTAHSLARASRFYASPCVCLEPPGCIEAIIASNYAGFL